MIEADVVIDGETQSRVAATDSAVALLRRLWQQHGPLMFHQSGGCCDGSSPMCYPAGELFTSAADVLLGHLDISESAGESGTADSLAPQSIEFWMSTEQFAYWRHTHLTVDVVPGRGSGFSVESPEGVRFIIRSRLMDAAEAFA
jgi:uncharacterized protein (DUF779 family)